MADVKRCMLIKRPYRDRKGKWRLRDASQCCGQRDTRGGCVLSKQPMGTELEIGAEKRRVLARSESMKATAIAAE